VLPYPTAEVDAAATIERLISAAGFEPVKAGGVKDGGRLERADGDLHQGGGSAGSFWTPTGARGHRSRLDCRVVRAMATGHAFEVLVNIHLTQGA
jgi:hypothetical protein